MSQQITIRNAQETDLNQIIELEKSIWPEGIRASKEKFASRIKIFPEGFFLAYKNGQLVGVSTSEIISYQLGEIIDSWENITDNGFIKKTHQPGGNSLYVVSVGALSRSGGGSALVQAQKELVKKLNLDCLVLGARIPGYNQYCQEHGNLDIDQYVQLKRKDQQPLDPELRFYTRNGLILAKIMPNYMEDDRESRNYGAIMIWKNK